MPKCLLLLLFVHCSSLSIAQTKLSFSYDLAGNQITRVLCINCVSQTAKNIQEIEIPAESDLEKFFSKDAISYYPNPVKEELYLQWQVFHDNYVTSVRVYSLTGQVLRTFDTNSNTNSLNIPFQQYSTGVYLVLFSYQNGSEKLF